MTAPIILGWPSSALSPNARGHWAGKHRASSSARREAFYAAMEAGAEVKGDGPVTVSILCLPPDRRSFDRDNMLARLKPHLDGIADALRVDDVRFRPSLEIGEPVKGGRVEVRLS